MSCTEPRHTGTPSSNHTHSAKVVVEEFPYEQPTEEKRTYAMQTDALTLSVSKMKTRGYSKSSLRTALEKHIREKIFLMESLI